MIVRRLGPLSFAKISGVLYAVVGMVVGCLFALISLAGGAAGARPGGAMFGAMFGVGAVIIMPVLYGSLGFVSSLVMAAVYNLVAGLVGGVEIQFEQTPQSPGRQEQMTPP